MANMQTDSALNPGKKKLRISETLAVGILLTLTGGFLDAYTYLYRGKVFANGQTGNLVLLGINLAEQNYQKVLYYLFPIFSFLLGVLIAERIHIYIGNERRIKWRHIVLILEITLLLFFLHVPAGNGNYFVNMGISFVCALQTQAFRSLKGASYISVMCTGNMRNGIQAFCNYQISHDKAYLHKGFHYLLIVLSFIFGAVSGSFFTLHWERYAILIPVILLTVVLLLLCLKKQLHQIAGHFGLTFLDV